MLALEPARSATSRPRSSAPSCSSTRGLAIWNGSWYGGHYTLTYSVLFPPLAALLGPQLVGMLSVVASSYLFDRLVRDRWGAEARWATLWFAAGVVTLLADGQLTFALGVAFGARGAARAAARPRRRSRSAAAAACAALQPGRRRLPRRRPRRRRARARPPRRPRPALAAGALALVLILSPTSPSPKPGQFPFVLSSFVAIPLWCGGGALPHPRPRADEERAAAPGARRLHPRRDRRSGSCRTRWAATRSGSAPCSAARSWPPSCSHAAPGPPVWFLAVFAARRQPLLAADRERRPDRPQRRRPLDQRRLLRTGLPIGCAPTAARARGSRFRRPPTTGSRPTSRRSSNSRAAGCARSTPPATTSSTTRGELTDSQPTGPGSRQRDHATSPFPTRRSTTPRSPSGG